MWRCNEDVFLSFFSWKNPVLRHSRKNANIGLRAFVRLGKSSWYSSILSHTESILITGIVFLPCFYSLHPSFTLWLPCGCEHTSISCQVCQVSFWRIDRRNNGAGDIMRRIYLKQVPQDSLLQRIEAVRFDKWFRRSTELNMSWSKGSSVCRSLITSNHFS